MPGYRVRPVMTRASGVPTTFFSNFPATENPISQGGKWRGGLSDGGVFNNVQTVTGLAYATAINSSYDDSSALIKSSVCFPGADQYAEGVYSLDPAYTPPNGHECELLLRGDYGTNTAPFYEITCPWHGDVQVVRQNGPFGDYTPYSGTGSGFGRALVTGDVVRAAIVANTIRVYLNTVEVGVYAVSGLTGTQPGMGFFIGTGGTMNKAGWSSIAFGPAS